MKLICMGLQDLSRLECWGEKAFSERFSAKQLSFIGGNKSYINFGEWVGVWEVSVCYQLVLGMLQLLERELQVLAGHVLTGREEVKAITGPQAT